MESSASPRHPFLASVAQGNRAETQFALEMDQTEPKRSRNDIVLIIDPAHRRGEWPLGRVKEVFPGPDGVVRSASVTIWTGTKTKTKLCTRAVHQLCVLETEKIDVSDVRNRAGCVADSNLAP